MLERAHKSALATIGVMLKLGLKQLRSLALTCHHEKLAAAIQHLEHAVAEIDDACLETR